MLPAPSIRISLTTWATAVLVVLAVVAAAACGREITGATSAERGYIVIHQPRFQTVAANGVDDDVIAVRVVISAAAGSAGASRVIEDVAPSLDTLGGSGQGNDTAAVLTVNFPIQGAGTVYSVVLKGVNGAGDTLYAAGPATFASTDISGGGSVTVNLTPVYVGPGANAATVVATPDTVNIVTFGGGGSNPVQLTAQAYDASAQALPLALYKWTSLDTTIVEVDSRIGTLFAMDKRGTAKVVVIASGALNPADTVVVNVSLGASMIVADSGASQSARVSTTLGTVIVVRVTASDGVAVPGAVVQFQTPSGGAANPPSATTDAAGRARTVWTLGPTVGNQVLVVTIPNTAQLSVNATATP